MITFLYETIANICAVSGIKLNNNQIQSIVETLLADDELWEAIDDVVVEEIARAVKEGE
jgi:hypothetical protein